MKIPRFRWMAGVTALAILPLAAWRIDVARKSIDFGAKARLAPGQRGDPEAPCGAVSAAVASHVVGKPKTLKRACAAIASDPLGRTSMAELIAGLRQLGLSAEGLNIPPALLPRLRQPVILYVQNSHFVVALADGGANVAIIDPPRSPRIVPIHALRGFWTGESIVVGASEGQLRRSLKGIGVD